jgi:hypothetical protein
VPAGHGDLDGEHVEHGSSLWRCEVIQVGRDDVGIVPKPGEALDVGGVAAPLEEFCPGPSRLLRVSAAVPQWLPRWLGRAGGRERVPRRRAPMRPRPRRRARERRR